MSLSSQEHKMAEKKTKIEKKVVATAGTYDILRRPIISEKAAKLSETNGVAFEVAMSATKKDVARAIQAIYGVEPSKVNIVVAKGKEKTFRGRSKGTQRAVNKAYVSLPADAKLDLSANA
jgi:large subunit ribosomal protein L23